MKLYNISFLLFFLSTQLFSAGTGTPGKQTPKQLFSAGTDIPDKQTPKQPRFRFFSPIPRKKLPSSRKRKLEERKSTGSRQKSRNFRQKLHAKKKSPFSSFSKKKIAELIEKALNPFLEAKLQKVLEETTKTMRRKCHLTAGFALTDGSTHKIIKIGTLEKSFYSCKRHKITRGELKHRGLCAPVGSHLGPAQPASAIHHHHSERAFFSALEDIAQFEELLYEAGIELAKIKNDDTFSIILYNKLSSCSICHRFIGQGVSSSLCDTIQKKIKEMTGKKVFVFLSHKGKSHHHNKENKEPTVSERYYSSDFFLSRLDLFHRAAATAL